MAAALEITVPVQPKLGKRLVVPAVHALTIPTQPGVYARLACGIAVS
jgi:hypothetical protein